MLTDVPTHRAPNKEKWLPTALKVAHTYMALKVSDNQCGKGMGGAVSKNKQTHACKTQRSDPIHISKSQRARRAMPSKRAGEEGRRQRACLVCANTLSLLPNERAGGSTRLLPEELVPQHLLRRQALVYIIHQDLVQEVVQHQHLGPLQV